MKIYFDSHFPECEYEIGVWLLKWQNQWQFRVGLWKWNFMIIKFSKVVLDS